MAQINDPVINKGASVVDADHRVIDLGQGAASSLGLISSGIAQVKLEVLR